MRQQGFTLIEVMVSISILVILTTVVLANLSGLGNQRDIGIAKNNLISDLNKAQSFSLSSRNIDPCPVSQQCPAASYALILRTGTAYSSYTFSGKDISGRVVSNTINFPGNTYVGSIYYLDPNRGGGASGQASALTVFFTVPYSRILQTYSIGNPITTTIENVPNVQTTIRLKTRGDPSLSADIIINGVTGSIN